MLIMEALREVLWKLERRAVRVRVRVVYVTVDVYCVFDSIAYL